MTIVKGIFDGKTVKLLERYPLAQPHFVDIVIKEAVPEDKAQAARRQRILQYAGMWADSPPETWENMKTSFRRRGDFFPPRDAAW